MKPEQLVQLAKRWAKDVAARMKFSDVEELESLALAEAWELSQSTADEAELAQKVERKMISYIRKEMRYSDFKAELKATLKSHRSH